MNQSKLSPLERLQSRKLEIKSQTKQYEQSISNDVDFLQEHAGSFLINGVTGMIFPKTHGSTGNKKTGGTTDGSFNIMSIAKNLVFPAAFSLAQPLLLSWGMGKVPVWILNFLIKRLKKK